MIIFIAAVDNNNSLGKQGKLLCHLPLDLQYFKKNTINQSILMGRKTYESIGRALPNRENFILTHQKNLDISNCICVNSLEEAVAQKTHENLFIIGGGEIFKQYLSYADKILLTKIHHDFLGADTFFPVLDPEQWKMISQTFHPISEKNSYPISFETYLKRHL